MVEALSINDPQSLIHHLPIHLGRADLDITDLQVKFLNLHHAKKEGLPVPDGIFIDLKPFYDGLTDIFRDNPSRLGVYLKRVSDTLKQAGNRNVSRDMIYNDCLPDFPECSARLSRLLIMYDDFFMRLQDYFTGMDLILRGGDDDVDFQAGTTNSIVVSDFICSILEVMEGYVNRSQLLNRQKNIRIILPFSINHTNQYFLTGHLPDLGDFSLISLLQVIPPACHAGSITLNKRYVMIEFSDQKHYHDNTHANPGNIAHNRITGITHGLDMKSKRALEHDVVRLNCHRLVELVQSARQVGRRLNPLFNEVHLEICMNLFSENLDAHIVQLRFYYAPAREAINPRSGIFQLSRELDRTLPCSGAVVPITTALDIALLRPFSIALVRLADWQHVRQFPDVPPEHQPRLVLTDGGTRGLHLIAHLCTCGANVARIPPVEFDMLHEMALANRRMLMAPKSNPIGLFYIKVMRDYRTGRFGRIIWQNDSIREVDSRLFSQNTIRRCTARVSPGSFREGELEKYLTRQRALGYPADYINPASKLVPFTRSVEDEEGDGIYMYKGHFVEFTINGASLRILELNKRLDEYFEVADPGKYRRLSNANLLRFIMNSGVVYNLTLCDGHINACNYLSTHFILRAIFGGGITAVRASAADGRVGFADTWNGMYHVTGCNRDEYLAAVPDILNGLATLKQVGLDLHFDLKYIQGQEASRFAVAAGMLADPRFADADIPGILDFILLEVPEENTLLPVMVPFQTYQNCFEICSEDRSQVPARLLWRTLKRCFNEESIRTGAHHQVIRPRDEWIAKVLNTRKVPAKLAGLMIVLPAMLPHPDQDETHKVQNALIILSQMAEPAPLVQ